MEVVTGRDLSLCERWTNMFHLWTLVAPVEGEDIGRNPLGKSSGEPKGRSQTELGLNDKETPVVEPERGLENVLGGLRERCRSYE